MSMFEARDLTKTLLTLMLAAGVITLASSTMFYVGLRRYESGGALNVNV